MKTESGRPEKPPWIKSVQRVGERWDQSCGHSFPLYEPQRETRWWWNPFISRGRREESSPPTNAPSDLLPGRLHEILQSVVFSPHTAVGGLTKIYNNTQDKKNPTRASVSPPSSTGVRFYRLHRVAALHYVTADILTRSPLPLVGWTHGLGYRTPPMIQKNRSLTIAGFPSSCFMGAFLDSSSLREQLWRWRCSRVDTS